MKSKDVVVLWTSLAVLIVGGSIPVTAIEAAQILSRPALQALLGGPGTLENFESLNVSTGSADLLDCAVLDRTSICNGQGPGLVVPGVVFTFAGVGQRNDAGYVGAPSREILSNEQPLVIDFTVSVEAFGVDLRAYTGFPATATMTIFGTDDTTVLGTVSVNLSSSGVPVFAGWEDISGIGRVTLTQTGQPWSPIIDNLEFGDDVVVGTFLTALSPAKVWVGLKNSDDVGLRFDLRAEVFLDGTRIGQGQLNNVPSGSSGFNNARLQSIALELLNGAVTIPPNSDLHIEVSARRTCFGPGHNSGTARVWFNGALSDIGAGRDAGSRFDATVDDAEINYFLRANATLSRRPGSSRLFIDVFINSRVACPDRPFASFGTWGIALP